MRKTTTILALAILMINMVSNNTLKAQAPEKMSFQAVVRNNAGDLLTEEVVGMQISILSGTVDGSAVYVETHTPTTNANGLVSLEIGSGTSITGTFSSIDWSSGNFFIKTETDPEGGTDYTITGTSQLLSVPYALYAKSAGNTFSGDYNDLTNKPDDLDFDGSFSNLTDVPTGLSDGDDDTQLTESQVDAYVDNNGYLSSFTEVDGSITNEIQDLELDGNDLSITNNASATTIDLSGYLDNTDTQLTETQVDNYVANNGYLTSFTEVDGSTTNELELPSQTGQAGKYLVTDGTSVSWATPSTTSSVRTVTTNATLDTTDEIVIMNCFCTVTLPASPVDGQKLTILTNTASSSLNGNGKTIVKGNFPYWPSVTFVQLDSNLFVVVYSSSMDAWIGSGN